MRRRSVAPMTYVVLLAEVRRLLESGSAPPCMGRDPELWFDETRESEERAKRLCGGCPLLVACGRHGIVAEEYGVWGAMTRADRRQVRGRG